MATCKHCMLCLRKCKEVSSENLCVDIGAQRVNAETTTGLPRPQISRKVHGKSLN